MSGPDITVDVGEPCAPGITGVPTCPATVHQVDHSAQDFTGGFGAGMAITAAVFLFITKPSRWRR